jgi:DNA-binding response OmpR family regulator
MLVEALKSANCTVIESDSRERGLDLMRSRARSGEMAAIDIVVCEIAGGIAAARQVQAEFEMAIGRPVATLAMSSHPDASGRTPITAAASPAGVAPCALLVKPFDIAELLAAVDTLTR